MENSAKQNNSVQNILIMMKLRRLGRIISNDAIEDFGWGKD